MPDKRRRQRYPSSPPLSPATSNSTSSLAVYTSPYSPHTRPQAPKSQIPNIPRRLLVPRYSQRCTDFANGDLSVPYALPSKSRTSVNRLVGRSRADSAPPEMAASVASGLSSLSNGNGQPGRSKGKEKDSGTVEDGTNHLVKWLASEGCHFKEAVEDIELSGFQVFAVERW